MNNETSDEIQGIIDQLKQLQLTQSALLERLGRLESQQLNAERDTPVRRLTTRRVGTFVVGDRVRVLNPGRDQLSVGHITRIGLSQITLIDRRGVDIRRAPKNLVLENNE
jgi:hypothetical protein